jgi:hypothetical protein
MGRREVKSLENEKDQSRETAPSNRRRRLKLYAALVLLFIATFSSVAYAISTLTIANTGTVVLATKEWQGITFSPPSSAPNCAIQTGYSDTPAAMTWGNIQQGTPANGFICVKNTGGTGSTYSVTTTVAPPPGVTVTYNGTATLTSLGLSTQQTSLINVVVTVGFNATPGNFAYTTTIQ